MVFDYWMYEDGIQPGHVIVIDLKGCSLGHVARIGLLQMKKFLFYLQVSGIQYIKYLYSNGKLKQIYNIYVIFWIIKELIQEYKYLIFISHRASVAKTVAYF